MDTDFLSIGIDFGTTNSSMAWYNPDTQQAEIILNSEGEYKTSSLVYFGEDETLVGKPIEDLLEDSEIYDEAEREDITRRTVRSIKRNLLSPPVIPIPGREPVRPVEVVAEILRKLKCDAEEEHFRETVDCAVITCPAMFDALQRKLVSDAAALAGFKVVELLEEPVAAAMAYGRLGQKVGTGVLVYDLGGGTFDLAMVAREEDGSFRVAMEPDGDPRSGGDDFDRVLYAYCDQIVRRELGRPVDLAEGVVNPYFLSECRKKKERLSTTRRVVISDYLDGKLFKTELDRSTFEGLIENEVDKTARKTAAMVERVDDVGYEVDTVVMIGGASRVPLVAQRLRDTLPVEPRPFASKDLAVALGAAYQASVLEVPVGERYRKALDISWADERLSREEVEQLGALASDLELGSERVAEIERETLGETVGAIFERQLQAARGAYRKAVEAADEKLDEAEVERLDALANRLDVNVEAAEIEREVLGDTKEATLESRARSQLITRLASILAKELARRREYRQAVEEARDRLYTLAADLGLGEKQAANIRSEVLISSGVEVAEAGSKPTPRPALPTFDVVSPNIGNVLSVWLKREGDTVKQSEPLAYIMDDDWNHFQVLARQAGVLENVTKRAGETVGRGEVIARIRAAAEEESSPTSPLESPTFDVVVPSIEQLEGSVKINISWAKTQGEAAEQGETLAKIAYGRDMRLSTTIVAQQSGILTDIMKNGVSIVSPGEVIARIRSVVEAEEDQGEPKVTNAARNKAEELGVALSEVKSKPAAGGIITVEDVLDHFSDQERNKPKATATAIRKAEELGFSLSEVGPKTAGGIISAQNVEEYAAKRSEKEDVVWSDVDKPKTANIEAGSGASTKQKELKPSIDALTRICTKYATREFQVGQNISLKKVANARSSFLIPQEEDVVAIGDATLFGSGKRGFAITGRGLYWKDMPGLHVPTQPAVSFIPWQQLVSKRIAPKDQHQIVIEGDPDSDLYFTTPGGFPAQKVVQLLQEIKSLLSNE